MERTQSIIDDAHDGVEVDLEESEHDVGSIPAETLKSLAGTESGTTPIRGRWGTVVLVGRRRGERPCVTSDDLDEASQRNFERLHAGRRAAMLNGNRHDENAVRPDILDTSRGSPSGIPDEYVRTIGIRGTGPGCGKDTAADMIMKLLADRGHIPIRKRFAAALKKTLSDYTEISTEELDTVKGKKIVLESWRTPLTEKQAPETVVRSTRPITDAMLETTMRQYLGNSIVNERLFALAVGGLRSKFEALFGESINGHTAAQMLQSLGTQLRGIFGENIMVDAVFADVNPDGMVVISDVRYKQENTAVINRSGVTILVKRDKLDQEQMAGRSTAHSSERDLDGVDPDFVIDNNGTYEQLEERVKELVDRLWPS